MKINALKYSFVFLGFVALPSFAKDHQAFSMRVFTSPDDQFWTNSTIIEGAHEVMLVDAQLTKTSAEKVLQQIKDTKNHCLSFTSHMSMPTISLVSRFLGMPILARESLRILPWWIESTKSTKRK